MMPRALRIALLVLLTVALVACATAMAPAEPDTVADATAPGTRVLVMLRMAPAHFRGDAAYGGDYGAAAGREALQRAALRLAHERHLDVVSEWPMPSLGVDCYLMHAADARPLPPLLDDLSREPGVAWAQALQDFHGLAADDPLFALQPAARAWHLAEIHRVTTGRSVLIAQIDSGVQVDHPDLVGQVMASENFVDTSAYRAETHGTAVAGVIAARDGNGIGIVGVAPGARLLALRACWETGNERSQCNSFTLAKALQSAIRHGAGVINMSLTGPEDRLLALLLDAALANGIPVVAAHDPAAADGGFPSRHPGVIAVGASASAAGAPLIRAPALDIPTTLPGSRWGFVSGSSFAAAQISGVVALLLELHAGLTPAQTRAALLRGAIPVAAAPPSAELDACAVILAGTGTCACRCRAASADTAQLRH